MAENPGTVNVKVVIEPHLDQDKLEQQIRDTVATALENIARDLRGVQ